MFMHVRCEQESRSYRVAVTTRRPSDNHAKVIAIVRIVHTDFHYSMLTIVSELDRAANIARNRAILEELELKQAVADLGIPKVQAAPKTKVKPVQPSKRVKRERSETDAPRRQSSRLKNGAIDLNELSPEEKRQREVRVSNIVETSLTH